VTNRRLAILSRAFFERFFASESVTSDIQLRQTQIWVLAFLLTPGLVLLIQLLPQYQFVVIRAARMHSPGMVDDMLIWIAFIFVTYSIVTVGLITVFVWDALSFDHRDAMTLGPLPIGGRTIVGAKLAALGGFLLAAALPMNLLNAALFALVTSDRFGSGVLIWNFVALLSSTVTAAAFVFALLVTTRGGAMLAAGPRVAAGMGSVLQFLFVVALLSLVFLSPALIKVRSGILDNPDAVGWLPTSWFLGLFEQLRGSTRVYFVGFANRALVATLAALAAAVVVSLLGYRSQMQFALSRPSRGHAAPILQTVRWLARTLAGRNPVARATSDFVLLTLARNRSQQTPVAMNAALGCAMALVALTRAKTLDALMQPRTIVLWIPLLVGYWLTIGLRASAFVPSELPAAWTFRTSAPTGTRAYWAGTRAAFVALVIPLVALVAIAVTVPLIGWRFALRHAAFAALVITIVIDVVMLTLRYIPFTTPYLPGHARLKTRWPLYFFGMWAVAYWPVRLELLLNNGGERVLFAAALVCAIGFYALGRRTAPRWSVEPRQEFADDGWDLAVLDIGRVVHGAHVGG
jgi:hypothetical protein